MKVFLGLNCEKIDKKLLANFEGVGLIRSEYLCRLKNQYITKRECREFIYEYVYNICSLDKTKMVWYRFTDLTASEINTLDGCDIKLNEKYHFLGTKGVRRHLLDDKIFFKEAKILKKISDKYSNIGVIIPYISSIEEYKKIKKILNDIGYKGKMGIMLEVPIILFQIDEFLKQDIDCFIVGMNDLTTLLLSGVRESKYHNKNNKYIMQIISDFKKRVEYHNKEFMVAGYFNKENLKSLDKISNLKVIINYSNLPVFNNKYVSLKELSMLKNIKIKTKQRRKNGGGLNEIYVRSKFRKRLKSRCNR